MHKTILLAVAVGTAALALPIDQASAGLFCCHRGGCGGCAPAYCGVPYYWCGPSHLGCGHHCGLFCGWRPFCGLFSCCLGHSGCGYDCGGCIDGCFDGCGGGCDTCGSGCKGGYDGGCVDGSYGDGPGCVGGNCNAGESYGGESYDGEAYSTGSSYDNGQQGTESNPNVIYDGPAAGAPTIAPETEAPAEETVPPPSARVAPRTTNQLASFRRTRSVSFERGLRLYREGNLNGALTEFEAATKEEPSNALYHYHQALTLHDLYGAETANEALRAGIDAEGRQAIANWGQQMERIQGAARLWIEKARRDAGLVR